MDSKIILASASPRRRELLKLCVNDFVVLAAEIDEKRIETAILKEPEENFMDTAQKLVKELALRKAMVVQRLNRKALVIGADTVVVLDDEILGKPFDLPDAYNMIKKLAGKTHYVLTGVAICYNGIHDQFVSESRIRFYDWDEQMKREVSAYVESGKAMDKAGGYGIQEEAGLWVKSIKGDYNNIVGLPVAKLNKHLYQILHHDD